MTIIPISITAGLTLSLSVRSATYKAPEWALRLLLRGPSSVQLDSAPGPDGTHQLTAAASVTEPWAAGEYVYSLRAVRGDDAFELEGGRLTVEPSMASLQDGTDVRRQAEITLANIEAVLQKRASTDQQRYSINNRELWRTPIPELLQLRAVYRAEVRRLRAKERGQSPLGQVIRPLL